MILLAMIRQSAVLALAEYFLMASTTTRTNSRLSLGSGRRLCRRACLRLGGAVWNGISMVSGQLGWISEGLAVMLSGSGERRAVGVTVVDDRKPGEGGVDGVGDKGLGREGLGDDDRDDTGLGGGISGIVGVLAFPGTNKIPSEFPKTKYWLNIAHNYYTSRVFHSIPISFSYKGGFVHLSRKFC